MWEKTDHGGGCGSTPSLLTDSTVSALEVPLRFGLEPASADTVTWLPE